jgi:hypothetical protein
MNGPAMHSIALKALHQKIASERWQAIMECRSAARTACAGGESARALVARGPLRLPRDLERLSHGSRGNELPIGNLANGSRARFDFLEPLEIAVRFFRRACAFPARGGLLIPNKRTQSPCEDGPFSTERLALASGAGPLEVFDTRMA